MIEGFIIRVGDRTSVFDSERTGELVSTATNRSIAHQRCLMSGGTCEATAYRLYGYPAAGVCVALGNYHNCAPDGTIAPEFVSFKDVQSMFDLCVEVAKSEEPVGQDSILRARLESELEKSYKNLNAFKSEA
jgi:putative aminopeptidase FrvX